MVDLRSKISTPPHTKTKEQRVLHLNRKSRVSRHMPHRREGTQVLPDADSFKNLVVTLHDRSMVLHADRDLPHKEAPSPSRSPGSSKRQ